MSYRQLIFIVLAVTNLLLPTKVSAANLSCTEAGIDRTDDRPQWQDVGLCDILAVTGGSTLTPPTTVRVVHDSPTGTAPTTQTAGARHYSTQKLSAYSRYRTVSGYIYLIRCLRL